MSNYDTNATIGKGAVMDLVSKVTRRRMLGYTAAGIFSLPFAGCLTGTEKRQIAKTRCPGIFALDQNHVRVYSPMISHPVKIMVLGDTHLSRDDTRGQPFIEYSKRMARGYQKTRHIMSGAWTTPEEAFLESLRQAREAQVDLLALVGDIFSFPSEAAIEWCMSHLHASGIAYLYVAGNHDWHYEGLPGSSHALRAEWTVKRLRPLYQGAHPLMAVREINGVRFVALDDSTYEVQPEQLAFFRQQVAARVPFVLLMHIPLYAPGRHLSFGCGHPEWGAAADRNWKIERRHRWPEAGHSAVTLAFHREVFNAPNLLGVFAGHTHRQSLDVVNRIPQVVTAANAVGGSVMVELLSRPDGSVG